MAIHVLISLLLFPILVYGFTSVLGSLLRHNATFPKSVPIVDLRNEVLAVARASLRQLTNGITTLQKGYHQYAQHGRPFIVYDPSAQQELLLPVKYLKWFAEQPDSKLSSHGVRQERHAVRYLHLGAEVELASTTHFIRQISNDCLNQHLEALLDPLQDELRRGLDSAFNNNSNQNENGWTTINVYSAMQAAVFPAMCRTFFGRGEMDPRLLEALQRYITVLGLSTIFVGELPRILKGLVAYLVRVPLTYYRTKTMRILTPLVESQLSESVTDDEDRDSFIRQCAKLSSRNAAGGVGNAVAPDVIAEWIMMLGFAGSSSTVIQATNLLLDIATSPAETKLLEHLRHEAELTIQASSSSSFTSWAKTSTFRAQILADSAIRESLRLHPILIKGLTKEVVSPGGLHLPDGTHMPTGGWVGVPVLGIHQDASLYPEPEVYKPFRFVKMGNGGGRVGGRDGGGDDEMLNKAPRVRAYEDEMEAARPTSTYLGFGYGRHACPGRWFAVVILKMVISHVSLNYDVEATGQMPTTKVLGDAALPPFWATLRVRRRSNLDAAGD